MILSGEALSKAGRLERLEDSIARIRHFLAGGTVKTDDYLLSMNDEDMPRAHETIQFLERQRSKLLEAL